MRPFHSVLFALALSLPLSAALSATTYAAEPDGPSAVISPSETIRLAVEKQLSAQFTTLTETRKKEQAALVEYYSSPDHAPLWVNKSGLTAKGKAVIAELHKAASYGLRASDYAVPDLASYDPQSFDTDPADAAKTLANEEVKISFAVVRYANDARGGRLDPNRLDPNLDPTMRLPKPLEVMETIAIRPDPAAYLRSFEPDQPEFERLRALLAKLRKGDDLKTPSIIIPHGPILRKGTINPQVALLRQRLKIKDPAAKAAAAKADDNAADTKTADDTDGTSADDTSADTQKAGDQTADAGDMTKAGDTKTADAGTSKKKPGAKPFNPNLYDATVVTAVKQFQRSHGLTTDGVVGPSTRRILNGRPAPDGNRAAKIRLILVNMERWRWLPEDMGSFYVQANIPQFEVHVYDDGKDIHTAKIVVGMPTKQTPVFQNAIRRIVFNPSWHVPNSIKEEEIKPFIHRNTGFFSDGGWDVSILTRNDLKVKYNGKPVNPQSIDWSTVNIKDVAMTQPPGPKNVLGVVKFMFPNKHSVYMHDTPQRYLFAQRVRDNSHGCMRLQNPDVMATILLKHDQGWDRARVEAAIKNDYDTGIVLHNWIPVYLTYFTAWVNPDGSLSTFKDIYGHDSMMESALHL